MFDLDPGTQTRRLRSFVHSVVAALAIVMWSAAWSSAQPAPAQPLSAAKAEQLQELFADPEVKAWLDAAARPASAEGAQSLEDRLDGWQSSIRGRLHTLAAAVPLLPAEFARASSVALDEMRANRGSVTAMFLLLMAMGWGAERLFRRRIMRDDRAVLETDNGAARLALAYLPLLIFSAASVGPFLLASWPAFLERIVSTFLAAVIGFRFASLLASQLLAPGPQSPEEIAADPLAMNEAELRFWLSRIRLMLGILLFGWATVSLLPLFGFSQNGQSIIAYLLGLGLLGAAIELVWRRPSTLPAHSRHARCWMLTLYLSALWLAWVTGLLGLLWLGIYGLLLPPVLPRVERLAKIVSGAWATPGTWRPALDTVISRGTRALIILAALAWLSAVIRSSGVITDRLLVADGVDITFRTVLVVLAADIVWNVAKAYFDHRLGSNQALEGDDAKARDQRWRTLLPIFRNSLAVFIVVVATLTILAGMGVQIGPLIAGAGIFGVAIGFGSQTLVRDVISGVFYMLDDAFRVGEYIQSGSYMGTVEGFSLRSVRLRHHRGPIYTVPFGELGAVQNMSRDWAIDKMTVNVTYDSDIDLARKLIKQIGQSLAQDPEFAPIVIQPLKMQGVDSFGEFAIALKLKMVTKPGQQYTMKRRALLMIKKAFDENGIKIATPTVQVSGGSDSASAAAAQATVRRRKASAATAET